MECDRGAAEGKTTNPSSSSHLRLRDDTEVVTAVGTVARAIAPLIFHNGTTHPLDSF